MPSYQFTLQQYAVFMGRNSTEAPGPPIDADIVCRGASLGAHQFLGGLDIVFCPSGTVLPPNQTIVYGTAPNYNGMYGVIYPSRDSYVWFLDAIRNEECIISLSDDTPSENGIYIFYTKSGWGHAET